MRGAVLVSIIAGCGENLTPPAGEPPPPIASCVPDRDGEITAAELPIALDVAVEYYVSPSGETVVVYLAGDGAGADRLWDLSEERAADEIATLGAAPLDAQWYAGSFPGGRFVVPAGAGLDAIYAKDDAALWLFGTASSVMDPPGGRTLVVYPAPVPILALPLRDGDRTEVVAPLPAATVAGLPFVGEDRYTIEVAGAGRLDLPYVRFSPVLRVRTEVVRAASTGGAMTSRRAVSFVFECFGEIARADSRPDEPAADFTVAAALRRFAL